jgi:phosphoribosylaminoimidazolecarboxamide formyltransferase/IMP cyclohydrolase
MTYEKRAILSVSDKNNIIDFAKVLEKEGFQIISTGGTAKTIASGGVPVTEVSEYTGSPEMFGGRVKTLHPDLYAGLLYRRGNAKDLADVEKYGIKPIDMVVFNLYPFKDVIADPKKSFKDAIENIDIGGPSMLRAAAKAALEDENNVTVVPDPSYYPVSRWQQKFTS